MRRKVECEQCGNVEFTQESGHYYCTQCQTQTQEIQEHVFEDNFNQDHEDDQQNATQQETKKSKTSKQRKKQEQNNLTSWECWNIVLKSLVDELIQLGADEKLKPVVKNLWMSYLEKLQVFNFTKDQLPCVPLLNSVQDTGIIYGTKRRKRRRFNSAQSSSDESQAASTSTLKRQMAKKKRALAEIHYESSQKTIAEANPLADETLQSIQSSSDVQKTKKIQFNKYALKELERLSSKQHVAMHKNDIHRELRCHLTYRGTGSMYSRGPTILTQNKIYILLYIGLLIIGDDILLSDMIRFIREGHLDFKAYSHLFPEEFTEKNINLNVKKATPFDSHFFRQQAAKLAHFLEVTRYIQGPNLVKLSARFCKELNLPSQMNEYVCKVIIKTKPTLRFHNSSSEIPSYEGRVISFIIFVLKLFFGLDNVTEFKFSYYAHLLNSKKLVKQNGRMFDIISWLKHIEYRRLFLSENHFPTHYEYTDSDIDSDLFIKHIKEKQIHFEKSKRHIHSHYKEIIQSILDMQEDDATDVDVKFPATLTPFYDYTKILLNSNVIKGKRYREELLKMDFTSDSLDFLTKSANYLPMVTRNGRIPVKNGGANDKWLMKRLENYRMAKQRTMRRSKKLVRVQYGNFDQHLDQLNKSTIRDKWKKADNIDIFFQNYQQANNDKFMKNRAKDNISTGNVELDVSLSGDAFYDEHYCPFERYWMNFEMYLDWNGEEIVDKYFNQFTDTYKILFKDCARIVGLSVKQLLHEYQMTEVYLVYLSTNLSIDQYQSCIKTDLKTLVEQANKHW